MHITVLVGNPRPGSRTASVALAAARAVAARNGLAEEPELVELGLLGPQLLSPDPRPEVDLALERVRAAPVLLVASPTYKATYSGLLKVFLDLLPARALTGAVALPLLLTGNGAHSLAVEVHLRPLLVELGALVPGPGLAVRESELDDLPGVLLSWARDVAPYTRVGAGAARGSG